MKKQTKTGQRQISIFIIIFFTSTSLLSNCTNNESGKVGRDSLKKEKQQRQQLVQERNDTTSRGNTVFEAALKVTGEAKGDSQASGSVILTLQNDSIFIKGEFSGLNSPYTASYIHQALEDDRIQQLDPSVSSDKTSGTWESSYKLDKGGTSMLTDDSLYISVYSSEYDSGELRGQLTSKEPDK